jgi:hypothetical protein
VWRLGSSVDQRERDQKVQHRQLMINPEEPVAKMNAEVRRAIAQTGTDIPET